MTTEWRRDALPFENRPHRQYVWLSGEKARSGLRWARDWWGIAFIRPDGADDGRLGYRAEDIARIEREGDMDPGTGEVMGWLPACIPAPWDLELRDSISVNAPASRIEARSDETPEEAAQPEGREPDPKGDAQS